MKITIEIPGPNEWQKLKGFTDEHLAFLWHVAQHNPAPISDRDAGEVADQIGREIIRRWLKGIEPELWHHQGAHHFWDTLQKHGKWIPINGDDANRQWTPNEQLVPSKSEAA